MPIHSLTYIITLTKCSRNDRIIEMKNRLVVSRIKDGVKLEEGRYGSKKKQERSWLMMQLFFILPVSVLISCLKYSTIVLENIIIVGNWVKVTWGLCIISYNCIYSYLK